MSPSEREEFIDLLEEGSNLHCRAKISVGIKCVTAHGGGNVLH